MARLPRRRRGAEEARCGLSVPVALIAAVAQNGVIGNKNAIPWRLPSDFAHFKRMTLGKPLIMGRKTFESIGRPLPGRTNIVVSRQPGYQPDGVLVISSLAAALEHAQSIAAADGAAEVMIGGGSQIYSEALPIADRLYLTQVALKPDGDTYFPEVNWAEWAEIDEMAVPPHPNDTAAFRIRAYQRQAMP
jgi:dihydrofolate reductase